MRVVKEEDFINFVESIKTELNECHFSTRLVTQREGDILTLQFQETQRGYSTSQYDLSKICKEV